MTTPAAVGSSDDGKVDIDEKALPKSEVKDQSIEKNNETEERNRNGVQEEDAGEKPFKPDVPALESTGHLSLQVSRTWTGFQTSKSA